MWVKILGWKTMLFGPVKIVKGHNTNKSCLREVITLNIKLLFISKTHLFGIIWAFWLQNLIVINIESITCRHFPFTSSSRQFLTNFLSQFFKAWKTSTHHSEPSSFVNCRRKKYNTSLKSLWIGGEYYHHYKRYDEYHNIVMLPRKSGSLWVKNFLTKCWFWDLKEG